MGYESIVSERGDGVALIILNRPAKLNALSFGLIRELDQELTALAGDDDVKVVVLTGAGDKAFSAGADIHEMAGLERRGTGRASSVPEPRQLAHRDVRQADHRCHQRARLRRGGAA